MRNEKTIKTIIIVSLFLIESFVWTVCGSNDAWSLDIIGGSDGPTFIVVSDRDNKNQLTEEQRAQAAEEAKRAVKEEEKAEKEQIREQLIEDAKKKGLLILVNKENTVDQDYQPEDLEAIKYYAPDRMEASRYMRAEAADAFHRLVEAAATEGIELRMTTAFRSYDFQKMLYDSYVESEGQEAADKFSAKPGRSEHQTGLAVDVSAPSVGYQLTDQFGKTREGKWLADNAYQYGFIIRFPKGKESITGYQYEPWHIRYVGMEAAKEIHDQGLTLEEFLQRME